MNIYYVYAYLREDLTPYYIGKGKNDRAWSKSGHASRGIYLPKDPGGIILLAENLTNQEALDLEAELIKYYGRKDIETGILHNKTDGGPNPVLYGTQNGMTGLAHSEDTRERIRKSKLGRHRRNDKRIFCTICKKDFISQGFPHHVAKEHPDSNILAEIRKHKCDYCDKEYTTATALRTHIHKKHPGKDTACVRKDPAVARSEN